MHTPDYLHALHTEYRQLATLNPARLTLDQRRSLAYFQADDAVAGSRVDVEVLAASQIVRWIHRAHAVDAFIGMHERIPRRNSRQPEAARTNGERVLAIWLEDQRRQTARARQCEYQRQRVDAFPHLDTRDRDQRWVGTLHEYEEFLRTYHGAPGARHAGPEERSLALWAVRQRRAHHAGTLSAERARALTSLPMWTWGRPRNGAANERPPGT